MVLGLVTDMKLRPRGRRREKVKGGSEGNIYVHRESSGEQVSPAGVGIGSAMTNMASRLCGLPFGYPRRKSGVVVGNGHSHSLLGVLTYTVDVVALIDEGRLAPMARRWTDKGF